MTEPTPRERIEAFAAERDLTMAATFVPLSASRNAKPGANGKVWHSLNWRVTLLKAGRPILETDYAQGIGHAPASNLKAKARWHAQKRDDAARAECETGKVHTLFFMGGGNYSPNKTARNVPPPPLADVLWSLSSDASVLDAAGFEDWAAEYGYDTDSRSAEETYRACLEIALKLRAALGDDGIAALRVAGEDF